MDLVDALLNVALDRTPVAQPVGRVDVATHQLLLAVLGAAQGRRARPECFESCTRLQPTGRATRGASKSSRRCAMTDALPSGDCCGPSNPGLPTVVALLLLRRRRELRAEPRRLEDHRVHPNGAALAVPTASPCRIRHVPSTGDGRYLGTRRGSRPQGDPRWAWGVRRHSASETGNDLPRAGREHGAKG